MGRRIAQLLGWLLLVVGLLGGSGQQAIAAASPADLTPPVSPTRSTPTDIEASDISSEKISQFVRAYLQVVDLIDQRETELQSAETESESRRIQYDIQSEAFQLIEATGLTRQEYLQLLGLANLDPEFGERVAMQLEEME